MIVCLDSGNSRIKWGVHDGASWLAQGAVAQDSIGDLTELVDKWPLPERVSLANVAGEAAAARIADVLLPWREVINKVRSTSKCSGITNLYARPEQLGVDRWCALIGAWRLAQGPSVVVMAGTATTIDSIDCEGCFQGGMILPGIDLMLHSLEKGTAALPYAAGKHVGFPRCTDDAIVTGVLEAQAGAIERAWHRLGAANAVCVVSGGNATRLLPCLTVPCMAVPNLVLEGLLRMTSSPDNE